MDENNKMKPPPRTLYIRCRQHHLNNRSEVSPKKFQENAISNLYLNTQPRDHEIQVKKNMSAINKYVFPQSLKDKYFYPQKVKNKNMQSPKIKRKHMESPIPHKF